MHTVTSFLPVLALLVIGYANDRWNKRPAARARWAALSLRDKITRTVRLARIAVVVQAGYLILFTALWQAGILSLGGWLTGTAVSGFYLAVDLYLLHCALAARRAYGNLGPLAYLVEIRHAFGGTAPRPSDRSENGVVDRLAASMPEIFGGTS